MTIDIRCTEFCNRCDAMTKKILRLFERADTLVPVNTKTRRYLGSSIKWAPFFLYQQTSAACFGGGGTKFGFMLCLAVTRTLTPAGGRDPDWRGSECSTDMTRQ